MSLMLQGFARLVFWFLVPHQVIPETSIRYLASD